MERGKPVELAPEAVGELDEAAWYAKVYRGGVAQLTFRAVAMGGALGFLLAFTNLYVGLKTGWHLGVAITACILSFSIWGFVTRIGLAKTPMTILENNCMQSTASAAGYATGGTMVSAIPALLMLSATTDNPGGTQLPWPVLAAWTFFLALLGTVLAIPMKRNMINQERLRFPSGTAAAVTLKSLYSQGAEAAEKGRALIAAAAVSGFLPLLKDLDIFKIGALKGLGAALVGDGTGKLLRDQLLPGHSNIFDLFPGVTVAGKTYKLSAFNVFLDHGVALVAAGALVGLRATMSMMAGALVLVFVVAPMGMTAEWMNPLGTAVMAVTAPGEGVEGARALGRRADAGERGPALVRDAVAHDRPGLQELRRGRGRRLRGARRGRGADEVVHDRRRHRDDGHRGDRVALLRHAAAPRRARGGHDVRARARRVPRDRRDATSRRRARWARSCSSPTACSSRRARRRT